MNRNLFWEELEEQYNSLNDNPRGILFEFALNLADFKEYVSSQSQNFWNHAVYMSLLCENESFEMAYAKTWKNDMWKCLKNVMNAKIKKEHKDNRYKALCDTFLNTILMDMSYHPLNDIKNILYVKANNGEKRANKDNEKRPLMMKRDSEYIRDFAKRLTQTDAERCMEKLHRLRTGLDLLFKGLKYDQVLSVEQVEPLFDELKENS